MFNNKVRNFFYYYLILIHLHFYAFKKKPLYQDARPTTVCNWPVSVLTMS